MFPSPFARLLGMVSAPFATNNTDNYYNCTKEILSCLGQMYVGDERFTQHIDQYGARTAAFMAAAIKVYTA
mgnify:CR=1 FL=1